MTEKYSNKDYLNAPAMEVYRRYQRKYAGQMRDSDCVLLEHLESIVAPSLKAGERPRVLDIGCSTGNLLLHLNRAFPGLDLVGGDALSSVVEECRRNPDLSGILFEQMDVLSLGRRHEFDVVIANAVLSILTDKEFRVALEQIGGALKPKGWLVAFDWMHAFEQELAILERSKERPEGMMLHFRPYSKLREILQPLGMGRVTFHPFEIGVDLEHSKDASDLKSYTIRTDGGKRMSFRGTLFQPWCHLVAQKD